MRPENLTTKIHLDGGNEAETKQVLVALGFLDGQTTNPSLIAKHPKVQQRLARGEKLTRVESFDFYRDVIRDIAALIPEGSVSIEVYSDEMTTTAEMLTQADDMNRWIKNAHIKFPTTKAGLAAAHEAVRHGMRVNMTLVFSEDQGAAVYAATAGAKRGDVLLSPFVGRLDDRGENGMDLIKNLLALYEDSDHHVEVLTASVRSYLHFLYALSIGSDRITAPANVLLQWAEANTPIPTDYPYAPSLRPIHKKDLTLDKPWDSYDIYHELTTAGVDKFAADWNNLLAGEVA